MNEENTTDVKLNQLPKNKIPLLVSGFGRCGSSLVMQMLAAGGYPVTGEYPAYEDLAYNGTGSCYPIGRAIKVLDPHRNKIPHGRYRWIWIDRDPKQQALSTCKFAKCFIGLNIPTTQLASMELSYKTDRKKALSTIKKHSFTHDNFLNLTFEGLITEPEKSSRIIAYYLREEMNVQAMASVVFRDRTTKCFDGLLEVYLEQNRPAALQAAKGG